MFFIGLVIGFVAGAAAAAGLIYLAIKGGTEGMS